MIDYFDVKKSLCSFYDTHYKQNIQSN